MNKIKLLSLIIAGLLISNLVFVFLLFQLSDNLPPKKERKFLIIEKLHFDQNQIQKFEDLIHEHRKQIHENDRQIRDLKNKLYQTLIQESTTNYRDSIIYEISKVQVKIENINYKHFEDIKNICRADQLDLYKNLTNELASYFAPPRPPKKGMPR